MSKPALICFHPSGKYLYSTDYEREQGHHLSLLQKKDGPKIIQIDYEFNNVSSVHPLYSSFPIQVYFMRDYELLTENELFLKTQTENHYVKNNFSPLISKEDYLKNVDQLKELIQLGHFYQINYTIPFKANLSGNALEIFHHYHPLIKGDYHALLPGDDYSIISFSPELFLKKEGPHLCTRPIKGTGKEAAGLINSVKESAELSMIVDLLRNDLNAVSDLEKSRVTKHRELMELGHLIHTYSEIQSQSTLPICEILKNILPGGSISGCPKKEACSVISKIEPYTRKAYTGIIGWIENDQALLSIAIRTFIATNKNELFYHSGGGIVYDSKAQDEYAELLLKASRI